MMRRAYFGTNALILLTFHGIVLILDLLGILAYVPTLFYPMFNLIILGLAGLGAFERDKFKSPARIALFLGLASLTYWIVMLILRLKAG